MVYLATTATLSPVSMMSQILVVFKLPFHGAEAWAEASRIVLLVRFTVKHVWLFQQAEALSWFNGDEPIQLEYDGHGEPDGHIAQGEVLCADRRRFSASANWRPGRSGGRSRRNGRAKTRLDHMADSEWLRTLRLHKYTPNSEGHGGSLKRGRKWR